MRRAGSSTPQPLSRTASVAPQDAMNTGRWAAARAARDRSPSQHAGRQRCGEKPGRPPTSRKKASMPQGLEEQLQRTGLAADRTERLRQRRFALRIPFQQIQGPAQLPRGRKRGQRDLLAAGTANPLRDTDQPVRPLIQRLARRRGEDAGILRGPRRVAVDQAGQSGAGEKSVIQN